MSEKLQGRVALVTGASRGIGRAIAIELAREGADVALNYAKHGEEAAAAAAEIAGLGRRAMPVQADVGDRGQVEAMFDRVVREFGKVDILVNNAAFSIRKTLLELDVQDVERTWATTLWGVFHCSQLAARLMVANGGGNILIISSVHAWRPYVTASPYNGAKAAINQMGATWAAELAQHNVRVNVIEPGWTDTPGERVFYSEEQIREEGKKLPLGRLATAEEMAKGAAFLVSDDASYVTGSVLRMDGGFTLFH
jgi:glucose 1-dehydrogenase